MRTTSLLQSQSTGRGSYFKKICSGEPSSAEVLGVCREDWKRYRCWSTSRGAAWRQYKHHWRRLSTWWKHVGSICGGVRRVGSWWRVLAFHIRKEVVIPIFCILSPASRHTTANAGGCRPNNLQCVAAYVSRGCQAWLFMAIVLLGAEYHST
jgi:hypothetical protein